MQLSEIIHKAKTRLSKQLGSTIKDNLSSLYKEKQKIALPLFVSSLLFFISTIGICCTKGDLIVLLSVISPLSLLILAFYARKHDNLIIKIKNYKNYENMIPFDKKFLKYYMNDLYFFIDTDLNEEEVQAIFNLTLTNSQIRFLKKEINSSSLDIFTLLELEKIYKHEVETPIFKDKNETKSFAKKYQLKENHYFRHLFNKTKQNQIVHTEKEIEKYHNIL